MAVRPRRQVLAARAAGVMCLAFCLPVFVDRFTEVLGGLILISFRSNTTAWEILDRYFRWFSAGWVFDRVRVFIPCLVLGAAAVLLLRLPAVRTVTLARRLARGDRS